MPVYNALPFLEDAVQSVLSQTFDDFEYIIIDDGSTDGSSDVLTRYAAMDSRIRLYTQCNQGLTPTLNKGLSLATGKYIARMDADDICFEERFEQQVLYLDAHDDCILTGGQVELIDANGNSISETHAEYGRFLGRIEMPTEHSTIVCRLLKTGWAFIHPSTMFRRKVIYTVKGYNPKFIDAEDADFFLRLSEIGDIANLSTIILKYRYHESQISSTSDDQAYWVARARRAAHKRRGLPLPNELKTIILLKNEVGLKIRQLKKTILL